MHRRSLVAASCQLEEKDFLIQCLVKAYRVELKQVHFGFASPLPTVGVPLDFLSRVTIPLSGTIAITASFDGKVEKRVLTTKEMLFTGKCGWSHASADANTRRAISVVFREGHIRFVYSEFMRGELKKNMWYHTSSGMKGVLFHTVQALNELMNDFQNDRFPRAANLLRALLSQAIIELQADKPLVCTKAQRTLALIKEHVASNYHLPITCKSISADLQMNPSYVSRLFSERSQETIHSFLTTYRMEKAAFILKNYDGTVKQVARQCGFTSTGYFIKAFKKFYAVTPGLFRSRNRYS